MQRKNTDLGPRGARLVREVEIRKQQGTYFHLTPLESVDSTSVLVEGTRKIMLSTYSYLGLLDHPGIRAAAKAAIDEFGTGTHGVRLLGGTLTLHAKLERCIARFLHTDDAITFSSGYLTNLSTIQALVGREDAVICDALDHASIVDGCLLSGARFLRFGHKDIASLERRLRQAQSAKRRLVVVDAVYSMDGDIAPLPAIVEMCRRYDARLMVDEAHSLGVLGENGRGIEEHFGLAGAIDIKMGTLSKTIPATGGYVAADRDTITFLKHAARGFIFSAAVPPPACAAALAGFDVLEREGRARRTLLVRNVARFTSGLRRLGFDTGATQTPIVPVLLGDDDLAARMTRELQRRGVFALPVTPPAVRPGTSRIRASVTSAHTTEQIDTALDAFADAGRVIGWTLKRPTAAMQIARHGADR